MLTNGRGAAVIRFSRLMAIGSSSASPQAASAAPPRWLKGTRTALARLAMRFGLPTEALELPRAFIGHSGTVAARSHALAVLWHETAMKPPSALGAAPATLARAFNMPRLGVAIVQSAAVASSLAPVTPPSVGHRPGRRGHARTSQ